MLRNLFPRRMATAAVCMLVFAAANAVAAEAPPNSRISDNVAIPEVHQLGDDLLKLNGFGTRTRAVFGRTYIIGLYLPRTSVNSADVFARPGPKRLWIHPLRELTASEFASGFEPAFVASNPGVDDASRAAFHDLVRMLPSTIVDESNIYLDFPDADTVRVTVNEQVLGEISEQGFGDELLRSWLGREPVQESLKKRLLSLIPPN